MLWIAAIGRYSLFVGQILVALVRGPVAWADLFRHTWIVVLRCLLPVVAVVFPFGMVMALQGLAIFELFGAQRMLASLISVAVLRELSPVLASVLVAAQGGSACAAELGSMRIKEELDATAVMGVDPVAWHVVPRVLALMAACPFLNLVGSAAGIAGGFTTATVFKGENAGVFMAELWAFTEFHDVWGGLLKTFCFGTLIGTIACYHGYHTTGGAAGVGRAVNDTVVYAVMAFIVSNYFLTSAIFRGVG